MPIYEGYALPHEDLDCTVVFLHHTAEREIVLDVKVMPSPVELGWSRSDTSLHERKEAGVCSGKEKACELPDGNTITVGCGGFRCPEVLFQPGFIGNEASDFHGTTFLSVTECDGDLREDLYGNVVLSGGTIMFDGIGECMTKQLTDLTPSL